MIAILPLTHWCRHSSVASLAIHVEAYCFQAQLSLQCAVYKDLHQLYVEWNDGIEMTNGRTASLRELERRKRQERLEWRSGPKIRKQVMERKTLIYAVLRCLPDPASETLSWFAAFFHQPSTVVNACISVQRARCPLRHAQHRQGMHSNAALLCHSSRVNRLLRQPHVLHVRRYMF